MLSDCAVPVIFSNREVESVWGFRRSVMRDDSACCTRLTKTTNEVAQASKGSGSCTVRPLHRHLCRRQFKSSRATPAHQLVLRGRQPTVHPCHVPAEPVSLSCVSSMQGVARRSEGATIVARETREPKGSHPRGVPLSV